MSTTSTTSTMFLIFHILFVTIIFSLYVQFSPTMGNIWLRNDSENITRFYPMNLIRLMFYPFVESYFWQYSFLPINFWVYLVVYLVAVYNIFV